MTSHLRDKPASESAESSLLVSIVNWKTADLTIGCLHSIAEEISDLPQCHVIVVDNGSPDQSADQISDAIQKNEWGSFVTLVRLTDNRGFAAGNNAAIRAGLEARPQTAHVLLLNPDTIVRHGAIPTLIHFMQTHDDIGIAGGRSEDPDTTPQHCCFTFPNIVGEAASATNVGLIRRLLKSRITHIPIPEEPSQVDWVSGAFMIVRTDVLHEVGLLDESFFLYFEETDFILRARRAGWPCWHVPQSRIVHLVGQSSGVTRRDQLPKRVPNYWYESRTRYFVMNHGRAYAAVTDLLVVLASCLSLVRGMIQREAPRNPPYFIRDLLRSSALFGGARSRKRRQTSF